MKHLSLSQVPGAHGYVFKLLTLSLQQHNIYIRVCFGGKVIIQKLKLGLLRYGKIHDHDYFGQH